MSPGLSPSGVPISYPKRQYTRMTFAPTNYTCGQTVLPYSIFAPRNITTLEEVTFANAIGVSRFEPQLAEQLQKQ